MNLQALKQLEPFCWALKEQSEGSGPVRIYGSQLLVEGMDEKVREQIINVAKLPGLVGAAMAMPDAHWGYGFPIGGVAAFDAEQGGVISAGGVGFDISCGIRCLRTNLFREDLVSHIEALADALYAAIPAGVGVGGEFRLSYQELEKVMHGGAKWAVGEGFGKKEDLWYVEENGCLSSAISENVSELAKKRQLPEMGTLGSGNHYLEVEMVDEIYDKAAAKAYGLEKDQIVVAIHCGSRGLGHQIGSDYLVILAKAASHLGIRLPERELACAPILSQEGQAYWGAMNAGINCALANRQILTHLTREAFGSILPKAELETLYDVSHNTCKREEHLVDGIRRELYIHRKGATRAFGPGHPALPEAYQAVGQPVFIGGSMGVGSYLLAGNSEEKNRAFASASHGAGRQMSRNQALKQWQGKELIKELAAQGIYIRTRSLRGLAEEAPGAYKDLEIVAESTEAAGLARRVVKLRPLICVKG
jgi:tRNA-splicing ligase RtcB